MKKAVIIVVSIFLLSLLNYYFFTKPKNKLSSTNFTTQTQPVDSVNSSTSAQPQIFQLTSPAFTNNQSIPVQFTCDGQNLAPLLNIHNSPADTKTFTLIVSDPDAPSGIFTHWLIWNLPSDATAIDVNSLSLSAIQGQTSFGDNTYSGPCPPQDQTHHYQFTLYALDIYLDLDPSTQRQALLAAIADHTIQSAQLTGLYQRQ